MSRIPKNFYNLLFVVVDSSHTILKKIDDYEKHIHPNPALRKDFYNIDFVYMHSIVLDIAKLISSTHSDKSGLKQLEVIAPASIKQRIHKFNSKYKDTIAKVKSNRNRIIAHIDISNVSSYFKMGFSEVEIDRKIKDFAKYFELSGASQDSDVVLKDITAKLQQQKSKSVAEERYSPSDFFKELPVFTKMVKEIKGIADDLNLYYYKKK